MIDPDILEALTELAEAKVGGPMPQCLAHNSVYERVGEWVTDPETGVSVGLGVNQWGTALSAIAARAKAEIERLRSEVDRLEDEKVDGDRDL